MLRAVGYALLLLGNLAFNQAQYEQALAFYEESLVIVREVKARFTSAWVMQDIGYLAIVLGQYDRAKSLLQDCLVLCQENGEYRRISWVLFGLGRVTRLTKRLRTSGKILCRQYASGPKV